MTEPASLMAFEAHNERSIRSLAVPRSVVAGLIPLVVLAVIGYWWVGIIVGVAVGVGVYLTSSRNVEARVANALGGRAASPEEFPHFHNLVEGLCLSIGLTEPELRVLDAPQLNLAVAGTPDSAVLVATTGLISGLDRIELEGVLAEALVRLRSRDAQLATYAAALICGPLIGVRAGDRDAGGLGTLFAARRAAALRGRLADQREFLADMDAVQLTRYPPGLERGLAKMAAAGTEVAASTVGTGHLWIADPFPADAAGCAGDFRFHEPIEHRAALMAEL